MKITITFDIELYHLEWAASRCLFMGKKLTKTAIKEYLKCQIEMFGIDDESLMGASGVAIFVAHEDPSDYHSDPQITQEIEKARSWVAKKFSA